MDRFLVTIDSVVVFDTTHERLSAVKERTRAINFMLNGYRRLVIHYFSEDPLYRSISIEWMRPSTSVFERIDASRFVTTLSMFEYMESRSMIEMGDEMQMVPFINRKLLESVIGRIGTSVISFSVKHDPFVNATIDEVTGCLTIQPIQPVTVTEVIVTVSIRKGSVTVEFTRTLSFMILDCRCCLSSLM